MGKLMNNYEASKYIRDYYDQIFCKHDLTALDTHLDKNYIDDEIGDPSIDQIQNMRSFLQSLFKSHPTVSAEVKKVASFDNVITVYVDWRILENGIRKILHKEVAIFVLRGKKIIHKHTFFYENLLEEATL